VTPNAAPQRPRSDNCEFQTFSTPPAGGYAEVAVIDVQFGAYGSNVYTDLAGFKQKIQPYVCRAGGDAALVHVNGYGMYIKATVLKAVAAAPVAAAPVAAPSAAAPDTACHYDGQCKGDRLCVKGECVDPPAASAPTAAPSSAAPPARP
jgi:hypothetical protein